MKFHRLAFLFPLALLTSCAALEGLIAPVSDVVADPVVQDQLTTAAVQAATGNYTAAIYSLGGAAVAGLGLWYKKRATESEPGKMI